MQIYFQLPGGQAAAATAYTLTGPNTGTVGVATSNFTVQSNGHLSGSVIVMPSDSGNGGTFTPTTVTLAIGDNTSATFTYTPANAGTYNISTTNDGGLTDPAPISFTASAQPGPSAGLGALLSDYRSQRMGAGLVMS